MVFFSSTGNADLRNGFLSIGGCRRVRNVRRAAVDGSPAGNGRFDAIPALGAGRRMWPSRMGDDSQGSVSPTGISPYYFNTNLDIPIITMCGRFSLFAMLFHLVNRLSFYLTIS